jgi:hypothetical protein
MVIAFIYWHIAAPFFRLGVQIFEEREKVFFHVAIGYQFVN